VLKANLGGRVCRSNVGERVSESTVESHSLQ
jgi:hypothetical protein